MGAVHYLRGDWEARGPEIYRVELSLEPEVQLGVPEVARSLKAEIQVFDCVGRERFLVTPRARWVDSLAFVDTEWLGR